MPERTYPSFTVSVKQRKFPERPSFTIEVKGGDIATEAEALAHVLLVNPDLESATTTPPKE